jgi:hypothetical protein
MRKFLNASAGVVTPAHASVLSQHPKSRTSPDLRGHELMTERGQPVRMRV